MCTLDVDIIKNYIKNEKLTIKTFCELCGISEKTYMKIMSNNYNFSIVDLVKIAKLIHVNLCQMFKS